MYKERSGSIIIVFRFERRRSFQKYYRAMASFRTHIIAGSAVGYAAGAIVVVNRWFSYESTPIFIFLASFAGSFLPDLDSDSGKPVNLVFDLASFLAGCIAFNYCIRHSGLSLPLQLGIPPAAALIVRFGVSRIFKKFTVHRGIFHSVPAALVVTLAAAWLLRFWKLAPIDTLAISLALGAGFVSHLVLDELCSVGFDGARFKPKSSLGSALALWAPSVPATVAAYLAVVVLLYVNWPLAEMLF